MNLTSIIIITFLYVSVPCYKNETQSIHIGFDLSSHRHYIYIPDLIDPAIEINGLYLIYAIEWKDEESKRGVVETSSGTLVFARLPFYDKYSLIQPQIRIFGNRYITYEDTDKLFKFLDFTTNIKFWPEQNRDNNKR